jgi:hypothetical protein
LIWAFSSDSGEVESKEIKYIDRYHPQYYNLLDTFRLVKYDGGNMVGAEEVDVHQISTKYNRYIVAIYQLKLEEGFTSDEDIPFDKSDVEGARQEFGLNRIKNVPDLKYNLRSRADLPEVLLDEGYEAVIQNEDAQRKDAAYLLTKEPDTIHLPEPDEQRTLDTSGIPDLVRKYSTTDEQGILTRVRYTGVLNEFSQFECHHLQSHFRTSGDSGQVEIDDLYIAEDSEGTPYAIIGEGKGVGEKFSRNQIYRNTKAVRQKEEYPDEVHAVGIKANDEDTFSLVEFDVPRDPDGTVEIERVWEFGIPDADHSLGEHEPDEAESR